jgi:hypothetical protein
MLNNKELIPKSNIFTLTQTKNSFQVCDLSFCNILAKTKDFVLCAILLSCLISKLWKPSSLGCEPWANFQGCGLRSCNLIKTNNFGLGAVRLLCLVSELQKSSLLGTEPRRVCWHCDFCSWKLLSETNNFALDTYLLICLVSKLHGPPSPTLKLRTVFCSFTTLESLPVLKD